MRQHTFCPPEHNLAALVVPHQRRSKLNTCVILLESSCFGQSVGPAVQDPRTRGHPGTLWPISVAVSDVKECHRCFPFVVCLGLRSTPSAASARWPEISPPSMKCRTKPSKYPHHTLYEQRSWPRWNPPRSPSPVVRCTGAGLSEGNKLDKPVESRRRRWLPTWKRS